MAEQSFRMGDVMSSTKKLDNLGNKKNSPRLKQYLNKYGKVIGYFAGACFGGIWLVTNLIDLFGGSDDEGNRPYNKPHR